MKKVIVIVIIFLVSVMLCSCKKKEDYLEWTYIELNDADEDEKEAAARACLLEFDEEWEKSDPDGQMIKTIPDLLEKALAKEDNKSLKELGEECRKAGLSSWDFMFTYFEEPTIEEENKFAEERGKRLRTLHDLQEKDSHTYAKGKHIVITEEELQQVVFVFMFSGMTNKAAEKEAFDFWTSRKVSFYVAESAGYSVEEKEVSAAIQEYKDMIVEFEKSEGGKSPMTLEIEGYGSEKKYYENLAESYRKSMTIKKHEKDLMKLKAKELNMDSDDLAFKDLWKKEYKKLVKRWINQESIKIVK